MMLPFSHSRLTPAGISSSAHARSTFIGLLLGDLNGHVGQLSFVSFRSGGNRCANDNSLPTKCSYDFTGPP